MPYLRTVAVIFSVAGFATVSASANAAEFWKCAHVHYSLDKRPGAPPPLRIPAFYNADGGELRLLNGKVTYKIVADTDFGLMAVNGDLCD
jgi:hypothetical protein